jgi:hypothetical protein
MTEKETLREACNMLQRAEEALAAAQTEEDKASAIARINEVRTTALRFVAGLQEEKVAALAHVLELESLTAAYAKTIVAQREDLEDDIRMIINISGIEGFNVRGTAGTVYMSKTEGLSLKDKELLINYAATHFKIDDNIPKELLVQEAMTAAASWFGGSALQGRIRDAIAQDPDKDTFAERAGLTPYTKTHVKFRKKGDSK